MYASNLLLRRWPLRVALYINRQYLDTVTFRDKRWKNYTYPVAAFAGQNTTGTLEIIPERTWVPRHFGFEDERPLGVAVGTINAR